MKKILFLSVIFIFFMQTAFSQDIASSELLKNNLRIDVKNNTPVKPDVVKPNIKINNKFELNEKVLNMAILPSVTTPTVPEGIIYHQDYKPVSVINPKKAGNVNANYPGLRGPNQLIIYTPVFGLRTGTNEFGTEAIVENNMVVSLNGADSIIPKNGFVISGHGRAKTWITKNIQVGTKVYLDYQNNAIRIFLTPESLIFAAKEKLKEVNAIISYYKSIDSRYNDKKASEYIVSSLSAIKKAERKPEKTQAYISEAMDSIDSAMKNAIPYYDNELKGIWVRPVETTPEAIEKTVERICEAGITDIFLETYFHGKTIYPSRYLKDCGVISQREEFKGFDPLEIWIKEAHKRNMKVHIWFETFYVGNEKPQYNPEHVLNIYPSWANKRLMSYDSDIPIPSLSEHNGYFLDPANSEVQAYLKELIKEIINTYKPDGLNLDYIRYPQTVDPSYSNYALSNWGYTKYARYEFKSLYGIDPVEIKYGTGDWELWSAYRQRKISEFLYDVSKITRKNNVLLTVVIFPDLNKCIKTKMQNWNEWSMNNYIDGFTPLLLTGDKNTAILLLKDVLRHTSSLTKIYPGIFVTFMGGSFDDLLIQIHKTREYKTKGSVLFDYAHLNDKYIEALKTRIYNKSYSMKDIIKGNNNEFIIDQDIKPKRKSKKKRREK